MLFKNGLTIAICVLVGLSMAAASSAADAPSWPVFHGPNGDNHSSATGLLKKWPADGPKLAWTAKGIGTGFASVSLSQGMIFTAGNIEESTVVTALGLDGKQKWQAKVGEAWTRGPGGTRSTPTIDGEVLYYMNPHGDVVCLKTATGEKVWGVNLLKDFESRNIRWALSESPIVDGDRLICLPGGPNVSMVAFDKKTGKIVWKADTAEGDLAGYATPIIVKYGGVRIILQMTGKALIGVNADSGKLLFRFPHKTAYDVNATTPIFKDGQVFISSGYGTTGSVMVKLTVDGKKVSAEKVWESRELDNHHGGVILVDGYLYGAAHNFNGGRWICLDWKTGEMKYAEKGVGKGSATYADGMLFTLSEKRDVGLVKATPDGHELTGEFETPEGPEGPTWAHPVVCDGMLYIRHGDSLYAYAVKE